MYHVMGAFLVTLQRLQHVIEEYVGMKETRKVNFSIQPVFYTLQYELYDSVQLKRTLGDCVEQVIEEYRRGELL